MSAIGAACHVYPVPEVAGSDTSSVSPRESVTSRPLSASVTTITLASASRDGESDSAVAHTIRSINHCDRRIFNRSPNSAHQIRDLPGELTQPLIYSKSTTHGSKRVLRKDALRGFSLRSCHRGSTKPTVGF